MSKEMTPKEALKEISNTTISSRIGDWGMESRHVSDLSSTKEPLQIIDQALTELEEIKQEVTARQETEDSLTKWVNELTDQYEELKRDVKRFMELTFSDDINSDDWQEYLALKNKLMKVGNE